MFNLGGAMKNITDKAEHLLDEKKTAAAGLLEKQVKESAEFLAHSISDAEVKADESKKAAIDGFEKEVEKIADNTMQEESTPAVAEPGPPPTAANISMHKAALDQAVSEAKSLVDKTSAQLKPALGQIVQDKVNPLAQDIAKKLQPVAGDVSGHVNTALAEGVKQLNPVVDDVAAKVKTFTDDATKKVSDAVDVKLKEADELLAEKREALGEPAKNMFTKAKGLFG
ncbi:protein DR_1172-like [Adelges cooleyi]|uniref:protein DR_1172-like n=1 Tax=Adelges cooleyi TaxID=133065 RepID=UPI002180197C|nr:protein DR_1172-like [Adelges cooleyi]